MRPVLPDTNIWIALAKRERQIVERIEDLGPDRIVVCSVVRAELFFGARKSQRILENLEGFHKLLRPFVSLPFDDTAAEHYGIIRATLERSGSPISANDLMISAIALANDCTVITRNIREFRRVPGLRVDIW